MDPLDVFFLAANGFPEFATGSGCYFNGRFWICRCPEGFEVFIGQRIVIKTRKQFLGFLDLFEIGVKHEAQTTNAGATAKAD